MFSDLTSWVSGSAAFVLILSVSRAHPDTYDLGHLGIDEHTGVCPSMLYTCVSPVTSKLLHRHQECRLDTPDEGLASCSSQTGLHSCGLPSPRSPASCWVPPTAPKVGSRDPVPRLLGDRSRHFMEALEGSEVLVPVCFRWLRSASTALTASAGPNRRLKSCDGKFSLNIYIYTHIF